MLYKANVSFAGKVSMYQGEQRELTDKSAIKDLTEAGYITEVKAGKGKPDETKRSN